MVHHSGKVWDVGDGINGHMDTPCTLIQVMHFFDKKNTKKTKINIEINILLAIGQKPHGQCLIYPWERPLIRAP